MAKVENRIKQINLDEFDPQKLVFSVNCDKPQLRYKFSEDDIPEMFHLVLPVTQINGPIRAYPSGLTPLDLDDAENNVEIGQELRNKLTNPKFKSMGLLFKAHVPGDSNIFEIMSRIEFLGNKKNYPMQTPLKSSGTEDSQSFVPFLDTEDQYKDKEISMFSMKFNFPKMYDGRYGGGTRCTKATLEGGYTKFPWRNFLTKLSSGDGEVAYTGSTLIADEIVIKMFPSFVGNKIHISFFVASLKVLMKNESSRSSAIKPISDNHRQILEMAKNLGLDKEPDSEETKDKGPDPEETKDKEPREQDGLGESARRILRKAKGHTAAVENP